jgi:hypothetical protein
MSLILSGDSPKISADGTGVITSGTAVTASGTSVDFTSIPSWVRRITVMFNGVSTNGASLIQVQLGDSGGVETTGYTGSSFDTVTASVNSTGFILTAQNISTASWNGSITLTLISGNNWVESGIVNSIAGGYAGASGGSKTLSATLDRIRITTVNGTDTFDAGSINILYE